MGITLNEFARPSTTGANRFQSRVFEFDIPSGAPCTAGIPQIPGTTTTDQAILNEVQLALVEPPDNGATFPSGLWTVSEVIGYLNQRYRQFRKDTLILMKRQAIVTVPENQRHDLPPDWIVTQRVVWKGSDPNARVFEELPRSDGWELDHGLHDWQSDSDPKPRFYVDAELPTLEIETAPSASNAGILEVLYVALGEILSNTGTVLTLPLEFVPAIKWGVIADMLGKVGRGHDPERAAHAESRYQEGVEAAKLMLEGWA